MKEYLIAASLPQDDGSNKSECQKMEANNIREAVDFCDYPIELIISVLYMSDVITDQLQVG